MFRQNNEGNLGRVGGQQGSQVSRVLKQNPGLPSPEKSRGLVIGLSCEFLHAFKCSSAIQKRHLVVEGPAFSSLPLQFAWRRTGSSEGGLSWTGEEDPESTKRDPTSGLQATLVDVTVLQREHFWPESWDTGTLPPDVKVGSNGIITSPTDIGYRWVHFIQEFRGPIPSGVNFGYSQEKNYRDRGFMGKSIDFPPFFQRYRTTQVHFPFVLKGTTYNIFKHFPFKGEGKVIRAMIRHKV